MKARVDIIGIIIEDAHNNTQSNNGMFKIAINLEKTYFLSCFYNTHFSDKQKKLLKKGSIVNISGKYFDSVYENLEKKYHNRNVNIINMHVLYTKQDNVVTPLFNHKFDISIVGYVFGEPIEKEQKTSFKIIEDLTIEDNTRQFEIVLNYLVNIETRDKIKEDLIIYIRGEYSDNLVYNATYIERSILCYDYEIVQQPTFKIGKRL